MYIGFLKEYIDCETLGDGLLTQGLVITITSIEQSSDTLLIKYNNTGKVLQDQTDWINSVEFRNTGYSSL